MTKAMQKISKRIPNPESDHFITVSFSGLEVVKCGLGVVTIVELFTASCKV